MAPPQPDFRNAARLVRDFADQFENCANLPVVGEGDRIIEALQSMEQRQIEREERQDERQIQQDARPIELEERHTQREAYSSTQYNAASRLQKSTLRCRDDPLTPLVDGQNVVIFQFPRTARQLDKLDEKA
ncbi:MAG: hypothetical protein M1818_004128 [Claussenomyces sp. TS43310]|nr:MAG: hypothetical protein M1818_004128 [Claussenomyces sp. TS43310]